MKIKFLILIVCSLFCAGTAIAQTKEEWSKRKAKRWSEDAEWSYGLKAKPHESTNYVEFASQYHKNQEVWDQMFRFLAANDLRSIDVGVYDIIPGKCYIKVQEYVPLDAEKRTIEKHEKTIDLQYTISGNERMGIAPADAKVLKEYNPKSDVAQYISSKIKYYKTSPDRFFLFFPSDLHQPSVVDGKAVISRKIVAKINYVD